MTYFYCDSRTSSSQDLEVLLRLLLCQLSPPSQVSKAVQSLFDLCNDVFPPRLPTYSELKDCLEKVVRACAARRDVYILIDGLDEVESEDSRDVYDVLRTVTCQLHPRLHLLVSSRRRVVTWQCSKNASTWSEVLIGERLVEDDVRRHVSSAIESDCRLGSLRVDVKRKISQRLVLGSRGS